MVSHILALGVIQTIRCAAGLALGALLILRSVHVPDEWSHRLEPGDPVVFLALGAATVALAALRGAQGILTIVVVNAARRRGAAPARSAGRVARRAGLALAVVDLVDLTGFPVSTACGPYALLVYRHPDAREFLDGSLPGGAPAAAGA